MVNKWDAEFAAHPLWPGVEQFGETLNRCPPTDDVAQREHLDRLRRVLIELDARHLSDPMLVRRPVIDSLYQALTTMNNQVVNYISNPAQWSSYLAPAANQQADEVLALLNQFPQPTRGPQATAARAAAKAYRDAADDFINEVRASAEKAIASVEQDRETSSTATELALAEVERLRTAITQTDARMTEQITRLETSLTAHQSAFETQQSERADRFQKEQEAFREKAEQQLLVAQGASAEQAEQDRRTAQQTLDALNRLHEEAKVVVEATGRRAVTSEFGQYAAKQARAAFWWAVAAVVFAVGGFGFIAVQIATLHKGDLSWQLVAYKIAASVALVLVAGFCAKQSAGHRDQERQAKRRQLEINALEPFLARLPEEQAETLRVKMADRILVQPAPEPPVAGPAGLPSSEDIGAMLGAALREATGTGKRGS
jgi:hypothetical protein